MQFIHVGTHTQQAHSNTPYGRNFYSAATLPQPRRTTLHSDTTIPNTNQPSQSRPRRKITMQTNDCMLHMCFDTETSERIIEYVSDGDIIMTLTIDSQIWAHQGAPYARRHRAKAIVK